MRAGTRHHTRARRGIVLVLVLAMLGLLALIGVTFATFSGQARINARNFAQSVIRPQDDELMDFALQQLITDTRDPRSVIHGHSLARDMYGNDAFTNGYLAGNPVTGGPLLIQAIKASQSVPNAWDVQTNIPVPSASPAMFGYNFAGWIMRVSYTAASGYPMPVSQTCQILVDDYLPSQSNTQYSGGNVHAFRIVLLDQGTVLYNPTLQGSAPQVLNYAIALLNQGNSNALNNIAFTLDGRWLHAFNGPGLGTQYMPVTINYGNYSNLQLSVPYSTYGNFRFHPAGLAPNGVGMDEDYDACDLENWFLAIQSADGQVMIPSFHRPGVVRYQDAANPMDWDPAFRYPNGLTGAANPDSLARILRPVAADGHDPATFPDLVPDPSTGKIKYDVDNDGDGLTDSVWLDLGYPARRDANGTLYKPLFAFMVIGLNGRIPLNTAGNLAGNIPAFSPQPGATSSNPLPSNFNNGAGPAHAAHLGNSVSEIDPQYGLQNGYVMSRVNDSNYTGDYDPFNQILNGSLAGANGTWAGPSSSYGGTTLPTNNSQVDTALDGVSGTNNHLAYVGVDVRLTQLRNLLAGTRPQINPFQPDSTGTVNGDLNLVWGSWPGQSPGTGYTFPNNLADPYDYENQGSYNIIDPNDSGNTLTERLAVSTTPPVPGRWGEAAAIPGVPVSTGDSTQPRANLVQPIYANPVRAGYSFDTTDLLNNIAVRANTYNLLEYNGTLPPFPRDAADDDDNAFDVYPPRITGEVGDSDYYDAAGALILPVERMRRFVTPVDINGTGSVTPWVGGGNVGADNFGRVQFSSYFRPPGVPGPINTSMTGTSAYGAIGFGVWSSGTLTPWSSQNSNLTYLPDVTNNPLHGYEFFKVPNQNQIPGSSTNAAGTNYTYNPTAVGGMPAFYTNSASIPIPAAQYQPMTFPTYGQSSSTIGFGTSSMVHSDGVNQADEMNLYTPNPLLDAPYGPSDLEWLYRQQDVDGATMTSRLSQLAPVSFTNTIDGQRRRRLYSLDSWETNNFVYTNDNPAGPGAANGAFYNNARFSASLFAALNPRSNATLANINTYTPSLAHRDKKINLNYPLPVSNDPNESVRQKWIGETYYLLKNVLPPTSVDSAEELAQLSQFVINIIDFRDPDATMTHWRNPDVWITPSASTTANPTLSLKSVGTSSALLDQYGMEYNPVALNEALAYSFQSRTGASNTTASSTNRLFIELVNTLTAAYNPSFAGDGSASDYYNPTGSPANQASAVNLGGFNYTAGDPYSGGCWDLVFTADNPMSRPDPYRGDLLYNPTAASLIAAGQPAYTVYGLIPLNRDAMTTTPVTAPPYPPGNDVSLVPLSPTASNPAKGPTATSGTGNPPFTPPTTPLTPPVNYFYVVGSMPGTGSSSSGTTTYYEYNPLMVTSASLSPMTQYFNPSYDPMNTTATAPVLASWSNSGPGILPGATNTGPPATFWWTLPVFGSGSSTKLGGTGAAKPPITPIPGSATYYWVCLRRPANPFAPVSGSNPMVVVDSMRFPYIDGTASPATSWVTASKGGYAPPTKGTVNTIYSAQRLQPYRGGHAVPMPNATPTPLSMPGVTPVVPTAVTLQPPDPRYGYTEQTAVPQSAGGAYSSGSTPGSSYSYGLANSGSTNATDGSTGVFYHTLGYNNDSAENWDYFPFNDRDFSSVAELLLVPGCPPGLFTKQFAESAPSQLTAANIFSQVQPVVTPTFQSTFSSTTPTPTSISNGTGNQAINYTPPIYSLYWNGTNPPPPFKGPLTPLNWWTIPFLSASQLTASYNKQSQTAVPSWPLTSIYNPSASPAVNYLTQPTTGVTYPAQPHAFPYLVDRFFYTGASTFFYPPTGAVLDPGSPSNGGSRVPVVGGPGGDGWYKMFEFFEVPSQAIGSIATVAQGANFDWARQDFKPGLMNINLIIDEEAFFGVFGSQDATRGFNQTLLNSIQLPLLTSYNANNAVILPYNLPLATANNGAPPIPLGGPPVPLVVSAIQPTGAPNYVYPITDQSPQNTQHGYLAVDPAWRAIYTYTGASLSLAVDSRIKAAFAQFLWSRHGGSGYLFGFGSGATGQNSAVFTQNNQQNVGAIPAERPFRSLSYPDINFTILRPAALPPSTSSNPGPANNVPNLNAATNAAALLYTPPTGTPPTALPPWYFINTAFTNPISGGPTSSSPTQPLLYAPFITGNNYFQNTPIVYSGDPGVRNPYLNQGYATADPTYTAPYPVYPTLAANSIPQGMPIPVNVAFPTGSTPPAMDSVVLPPPIPPARLFQPPDAYGAGLMQKRGYRGMTNSAGNIPPAVSNATDSGDPWINNQVANQWLSPFVNNMNAFYYPAFTLNNGFTSLAWSGGLYYNRNSSAPPLLTPTGALPTSAYDYFPYSLSDSQPPPLTPARLTLSNGYFNGNVANGYSQAGAPAVNPYLGSGTSDDRQHPYWRTELIQKAMNLTTVRTHQYAVWITVGFFEVRRQGDIGMLAQGLPQLAFDVMGPEVGSLNGQNVRYRGFFLVDRLKLTGFNPGDIGAFHKAVVYRKLIQ